ncbi:TrkH family potassium uptake protein [Clostridium oryzae]|uniref:Ktr system potassium uptake protein B n=1 Tax=Clostridium oryzae TaxID=1450648 RepID=A0A1V4IGD3_9CLOT|nr:TrkH family potassium uptake protein [Clostridium oryzae]OPJ59058.1 Ktr system potassium uptake protein B [Clostridium oryzae]
MKIQLKKRYIKFTPVQILAIGFAVTILIGAVLLTLPVSASNGRYTSFIDSLFVSTSAVCVTGLVTVDTGTHWSYFGKTIILILIQIGGLGFMSFATLFALILGKRITLSDRLVMQEAMNSFKLQGLVKLAKYILVFTFSVEAIGAFLLSTQFIQDFGVLKGIYYGIFHSVSAFCNAGIDLLGEFTSVTSYSNNWIVLITIALLIISGGLGFSVWADIYNKKTMKKLTLHSKVVIMISLILIIMGSILMFLVEYDNDKTIGNMTSSSKILNSIFAAVTPRTAGFNSIITSDMTSAGIWLTIVLMFIGGSPGSTAGGIKTSTLGIIIFSAISLIRGKDETVIFRKRISKEAVMRAFVIATLGITIVVFVTMVLSITEAGAPFEYILYEVTSAFATVGLTLGLTTKLTVVGKIIIIITMYFGRVGPLTLALALARQKKSSIRYPEDKILVG